MIQTKAVLVALAISLTTPLAIAQGATTTSPVRMGDKLVRVGDSEAQVLATAKRSPDRETTLESKYGGAVGQRWVYIEQGHNPRAVTIEIVDGRVSKLWSERLR